MGTDNPKVSAYVPQALKDRLKGFREKRDISESQAVTIILAEYFQMPEVLGRLPEAGAIGGVTLARMEALEERLTSFAEFVEKRLQEITELVKTTSELPVVHSEPHPELLVVPPDKRHDGITKPSGLLSEPLTESLIDESIQQAIQPSEPIIGTSGKLLDTSAISQEIGTESSQLGHDELKSELSSSPPTEQLFKPFSAKLIAHRLRVDRSAISKMKGSKTEEQFREWTSNKDPDNIAWKLAEDGKNYVPASELDSELLGKLLKWLEENSSKPTESKSAVESGAKDEGLGVPGLEPCSGRTLSKRLGVAASVVSRHKSAGKTSFLEWSRSKDPDKTGWKYSEESGNYIPVTDVDSSAQLDTLHNT